MIHVKRSIAVTLTVLAACAAAGCSGGESVSASPHDLAVSTATEICKYRDDVMPDDGPKLAAPAEATDYYHEAVADLRSKNEEAADLLEATSYLHGEQGDGANYHPVDYCDAEATDYGIGN